MLRRESDAFRSVEPFWKSGDEGFGPTGLTTNPITF